MDWRNSNKDGLPKNKEEVLISVNGINYIAVYNATEQGFEVRETKKFFWVKDNQAPIYWQELTNPD